jgi:hypothetical protein
MLPRWGGFRGIRRRFLLNHTRNTRHTSTDYDENFQEHFFAFVPCMIKKRKIERRFL